MDEFHFLRPLWLIALPVGIWLIWKLFRGGFSGGSWHKVVDLELHEHVLARPEVLTERRRPMLAALMALLLAVIALAGPTWERMPVPAYRSQDALVIALDLSRSMDAADLEPSRLARARLKLLSLLERRQGGETALVVFTAHAFTVTPLTTDTRTIAALVGALYTDIMPSNGSYPEVGLEKAATLLRQAGLGGGEILLISDADVSDGALAMVRDLRGQGFTVSVLAVGTEAGAPIAVPEGGFLTDGSGQVVIPALDVAGLRRLAQAGGGRFAQLSPDERDLAALFPSAALAGGVAVSAEDDAEYEADVWREQGVWLAVLLLPLLALGFRRGWICFVCAGLLAPLPEAQAFDWSDLWSRPDERGFAAMQDGEPNRAAELFVDPDWRAAAQYRAGTYEASAATLSAADTPDALYNRGNALARAGQLQAAIEAYDRAIELDPEHEDAIFNRDLVRELLEQTRNQDDQSAQQQQNSESGQGEQQQTADSSDGSEQSDSGDSESGQEQPQSQASAESRPGQDDSEQNSDDQSDAESSDSESRQADAENTQQDGELQASRGSPEDIEEWASDQAADQWLRRIPQDPGGLLRRKFLYQYQRLGVDQDGNYVWPGDESRPW
jgi:Ca-activated chloride channel family protein